MWINEVGRSLHEWMQGRSGHDKSWLERIRSYFVSKQGSHLIDNI